MELTPLPGYARGRRYLVYDLNDDGCNEYFVLDNAGVNKAVFVLVDSGGRSLLPSTEEDRTIWCDWLLVMESKRKGYCDLISSGSDASGQECRLWKYNGNCYVPQRVGYKVDKDALKGAPHNPGVLELDCRTGDVAPERVMSPVGRGAGVEARPPGPYSSSSWPWVFHTFLAKARPAAGGVMSPRTLGQG